MRCSRTHILRILLALCLLNLFACSSLTKRENKVEEPVLPEGVESPFVLIPSPYQPGDVPAQAQQEFAAVKAAIAEKQWAEAEGLLNLMIETYPNLSGLYVNLGIVLTQQEKREDAGKAFAFAVEVNPQNMSAYAPWGIMLREQGKFAEAEQVYVKALEVWPHHLESNINLGVLYDLYMGKFDLALQKYELAQKIKGGEDRRLKGWIADLKRRMAER